LSSYPRCLRPSFEPFDPVELALKTEKIVCRGDARKYTDFYVVGVYGGIATGYAAGCCLLQVLICRLGSHGLEHRYLGKGRGMMTAETRARIYFETIRVLAF
jgi:uncharacterized Fe-S cluster-containing radical SAM superfamily protein